MADLPVPRDGEVAHRAEPGREPSDNRWGAAWAARTVGFLIPKGVGEGLISGFAHNPHTLIFNTECGASAVVRAQPAPCRPSPAEAARSHGSRKFTIDFRSLKICNLHEITRSRVFRFRTRRRETGRMVSGLLVQLRMINDGVAPQRYIFNTSCCNTEDRIGTSVCDRTF